MVDVKRIFVFVFVGMFLISMMGVVVGAEDNEGSGETIWDKITNMDVGVDISDSVKGLVSKLLLIALVVFLVYSIASELPFLKGEHKDGIRWAFSIIVGILSFIFVPTADVMAILTTYEALGIALTSIIPLIILLVFSWELKKSHPEVSKIIDKPLLILFSVYLVYKWLNLPAGSDLGYIYIFTVILSILWAFGLGSYAFGKWAIAKQKEKRVKAKETLNKSVDYSGMTAAAFDKLSKVEQEAYKSGF